MVYLECGFRAQMLRRHPRVQHGVKPEDYRARWNTADRLSVDRAGLFGAALAMAKELGLGRKPGVVAARPRTPLAAAAGIPRL